MSEVSLARLRTISSEIARLQAAGTWDPSEMRALLTETGNFLEAHPAETRKVLTDAQTGWLQQAVKQHANVIPMRRRRGPVRYPGTIRP